MYQSSLFGDIFWSGSKGLAFQMAKEIAELMEETRGWEFSYPYENTIDLQEIIMESPEAEVDDAVEGLSSLMEPLIMVVLGTLIGGMVVAMYLPIFLNLECADINQAGTALM